MVLAVGCTQTSRVDDSVSTGSLTETKKAVAVMRVGSAGTHCVNVHVLLGVRDGHAYRHHQTIKIANVRSVTELPVAEVELDPGEYHVVAYACQSPSRVSAVGDSAGGQLYRTSFASFTLEPGEIVNVGYLHLGASRVGRSAFGRPFRVDVSVSDWPLDELDRFKAKRPHIYAQMKTRLMTVLPDVPSAPVPTDCAKLKALQAEGKVQRLPSECTVPVAAKRAPAAVAKQGGN